MYDQLSFKIDELNQMVGTNGNKVTAPVSSLLFSLKEMIDLLSVQNSPRLKKWAHPMAWRLLRNG